ncbi:F-box protein At3g07870-like [Silene latifolia]|uniref:F-box protein At3g07870-like n=1 Tax=Silene latifolia TaxID=37657 RepID=UPI003D76CD44
MARSKSVCKTWNSITSSTRFMDYYHKNIRQVEGNLLIFFKDEYNYNYIFGSKTNFYTLSPRNGNTIVGTAPLDYYTRKRGKMPLVTFLGSCNGLVAILCDRKLILWNPLTNEQSSVRVRIGWARTIRSESRQCLFGLCYNSSKDEYVMVVRFEYGRFVKVYLYNFNYCQERQNDNRLLAEFRLLDRKLFQGDIGKILCGLPHWVIQYRDSIDPIVKTGIVYFDLNEVKFKKIAQPDWSDDKTMLGLATLDGENQVGCVLHDIACANLEVWVMKEYGNSESWSNMFTFPRINMVDNGRSIRYMNVLGFMPNGELIINLNDKEFWVYDIHKGNIREMKSQYINFDFAILCEPTLISPPEPFVEFGDERVYNYEYDYYYYEYDSDYEYEYDYYSDYEYEYGYYYYYYEYKYDYYYDYTYYGLYVNEVEYEDYVNELYAKWSRLRSRMGRKHCITCM